MMDAKQVAASHALLAYIYNTSGVQFATDVFGADVHPSYHAEKAELYSKSPVRALGYLDDGHFTRVCDLAWERYGAEATRRYGGLP